MPERTDTEIFNLKRILGCEQAALFTFGLKVRCPAHPAYRAIHKPRVECRPCETLYAAHEYAREQGWE